MTGIDRRQAVSIVVALLCGESGRSRFRWLDTCNNHAQMVPGKDGLQLITERLKCGDAIQPCTSAHVIWPAPPFYHPEICFGIMCYVIDMSNKTDRELLQAALPALDWGDAPNSALIEEIRTHLTEPDPEPVAWMDDTGYCVPASKAHPNERYQKFPIPLYRHPRQLVRLSDVEISEMMNNVTGLVTYKGYKLFAEKIMDAMIEKNQ